MYEKLLPKTNPAPRISFVETRIRILLRIRPKLEKILTFFIIFSSDYPNYMNIENINSNEKQFLIKNCFIYVQ